MSRSNQKKDSVTVYPVPGCFLWGVPTIVQEVDADTAARYVETGAFTYDPPDEVAPAEQLEQPEA